MSNLVQYRRERKPLPHELLFMYRQRANLTQLELADLLDLKSSKMMQLWENGYRLPAAIRLKKLIEVYYQREVFTHNREAQEVHELWTSVKDAFDARAETYQTYPIFDELWFDTLQTPEAAVKAVPPPEPAPTGRPLPLHLTRPNNLPTSTTPLVGRENEISRIGGLLSQAPVRLLTITGPGGVGKTRLSLQAAHRLLAAFEDGVFFVPLAAIYDPALVPAQIAQVLGIKESGDLLQGLQTYLRDRQILLVLDNFEQIVAARDSLMALLEMAPGLKFMITSRVVLRLYGEHEFNVTPLPVPDPADFSLEQLADNESVKLFVERARQFRPDFILTAANAATIGRICLRLEGLPLALELASSWLKLFTPQVLIEKLEQSSGARLQMLTGGARNLAERQQTLRKTLEWSFRLLEPFTQELLARLAVFRAGGSLDAAEVVCSDLLAGYNLTFFEGISSLVDHSLLRIIEPGGVDDSEPRFEMLETIREYGLEKLAGSGREKAVRQAHCDYYLGLVKQAQANFQTAQQAAGLDRLENDHPNLRAALEWALGAAEDEPERAAQALELGVVLSIFWNMHGHLTEGRKWLNRVISKPVPGTSLALQARLLNNAALLASRQNDTPEAARLLGEALTNWRELDDRRNISLALNNLGIMAYQRGDLAQARQLYEECLALKRELGEPRGLAAALNNLGELLAMQGETEQAQIFYEESLTLLQKLGDNHNIALALLNLGKLASNRAEPAEAVRLLVDSFSKLLEVGDKFNLAENLESLAEAISQPGLADWYWAARLCGAATALRHQIDAPRTAHRQADYNLVVEVTQAQLSRAEWQKAWNEGQTLTLEQLAASLTGAATGWQAKNP